MTINTTMTVNTTMTINTTTLRNIRLLSAISMLAIVAAGFIFPTSIVYGLVVSPILLIVLMSLYAYVDFKINSKQTTCQVHLFPVCRNKGSHDQKKAA